MRFVPKADASKILIGQPVRVDIDVGLATRRQEPVQVEIFSGSTVLNPGSRTGQIESIDRILSPLAQHEVGTLRCIGLNVSIFVDYSLQVMRIVIRVPEV